MNFGGKLFAYGAVFYLVVAAIYAFVSQDWAGTTFLVFTGLMAGMVAFYAIYISRRLNNRPEDDKLAVQEEADPDYGFYSPHSWWPLPMGFSAFMIALGFIFAAWLVVAGVVFLMLSIIGLVFEYYRGDFAH